ncbi:MAG: hypothetical protein R3C53_19440 [Pirellulaceae bacterium]
MFRIGVKQVLVATFLCALGVAAVATDQPSLHFLLNLLMILLLASRTLGALLLQDPEKTAALGAAVFGWAFVGTTGFSGVDSIADHLIPAVGLEDRQRTALLLSIRTLSTLPMMYVGQLIAIRLHHSEKSRTAGEQRIERDDRWPNHSEGQGRQKVPR